MQISLLTCGQGNTIEAIYGHNAIRVRDYERQIDVTYNYGTFDFDTPHFAIKFMRGKLPYKISASRYEDFLSYYHDSGRSVTEQVLNLDSLEKVSIIRFLNENMLPENREYMYDFFMDNCATRIRDVLENHVQHLNWNHSGSPDKTFRQIIKEYQSHLAWTDFGIDLIIGAGADKIADYREVTFIPDYLSVAVSHMTSGHTPISLEKSRRLILEGQTELSDTPFILSPVFIFALLFLIEIVRFKTHVVNRSLLSFWHFYDQVWMFMLLLAGVLMIFMWWGTDHIHTKQNWNILWANPLLPLWYWKHRQFGKVSLYLYYALILMLFTSIIQSLPGVHILPQYFHPAVAPVCAIILLKMIAYKKQITNQ